MAASVARYADSIGASSVVGHKFGVDVFRYTERSVLASHAAVLVATDRRVGVRTERAVDAHSAGAHPFGDSESPLDIGTEHGSVETVRGFVGDPNGIILVSERQHGLDGSEDL